MRKIINIPGGTLLKKIEYYQNEVFYHRFTTSTITTLIALGIRYLEEGKNKNTKSEEYILIPKPKKD